MYELAAIAYIRRYLVYFSSIMIVYMYPWYVCNLRICVSM